MCSGLFRRLGIKPISLLLFCLLFGIIRAQPYLPIVRKASKETGVPVYIIMGVILTESSGFANATSAYRKDGHRDEGIMQLNSKYLGYFEWKFNGEHKIDPFSPVSAIPVGTRILALNYVRFGNWIEALSAYRQGIVGVLTRGVTHESFHYVESVMSKGAPYRRKGE